MGSTPIDNSDGKLNTPTPLEGTRVTRERGGGVIMFYVLCFSGVMVLGFVFISIYSK